MSWIVRSIDLGYGNTKFTLDVNKAGATFKSFESVAIPAVGTTKYQGTYNVMNVDVGDRTYAVGDEAPLLSSTSGARPKHDDFASTPQYEALMKGALLAMNVPRIDVLVIGLPVRIFPRKEKVLREKWKGTHKLTDDKTIEIRNVIVVMQPLGGYMDYRSREGVHRNDNFVGRTLVVDPGWHTLDWLMIEGMSPLLDSTDSVDMGVSGMLKKVGDAISRSATDELPFPSSPLLTQVDSWVRDRVIVLHGGKLRTPIAPYLEAGLLYIEDAISKMKSDLQEKDTIVEIVLVGGAAPFYMPAIKKEFPHLDVLVPKDPVYANVRGYHDIGVQMCRKFMALRKAS